MESERPLPARTTESDKSGAVPCCNETGFTQPRVAADSYHGKP
jgi:hypothetical protein